MSSSHNCTEVLVGIPQWLGLVAIRPAPTDGLFFRASDVFFSAPAALDAAMLAQSRQVTNPHPDAGRGASLRRQDPGKGLPAAGGSRRDAYLRGHSGAVSGDLARTFPTV